MLLREKHNRRCKTVPERGQGDRCSQDGEYSHRIDVSREKLKLWIDWRDESTVAVCRIRRKSH